MDHADKPGKAAHGSPGDFLARWSRRKIDARDEAVQPDDPNASVVLPPEAGAAPPAAREPEQELTDADMPPLETLNADSDYAPFMSPGVSDGLRQKALRVLFSQPDCNITDGLNDYDEDYTQFASLGSIVTHEMKRMLMRELEAEKNRQPEADAPGQESRSADAEMPVTDPVEPPPQTAESGELDTDADTAADRGQVSPGGTMP